ncbi:MAG TPA: hypothetical protein VFX17_01350 [Patescibacteria group bacterium]|nr:hypothetical protein [Patescibacteria group bacterium]
MKEKICPDCGPAQVDHLAQYISVLADWLLSPLNKINIQIRRSIFAPIFLPMRLDRLALPIFRLLTSLGLGSINQEPNAHNSLRAQALWESAKKLGIKIYEFRLLGRPLETFVAIYGNESKFFYEIPRPQKPLSEGFWWMDDKPTMRRHFQENSIPVAVGGACFRYSKALRIFRSINGDTIIKPSQGSRSRHTTVHIKTEAQLRQAFKKAKQLSPFVLVEQQLQGKVYRATVIGGKAAAVLSRNRPCVVGNGQKTIRELVQEENKNPKRHETEIFHEIPVDSEAEKELQRQGLNFDSIPKDGDAVYLSDKVSRGVGAITEDFTDNVHPDNKQLFEKIAKVVDDPVIGIDFIINDMSRSYRGQKLCGVIECNSSPFLDLHHHPYQGEPRDVSSLLWQLIFQIPVQPVEKAV